MTPEAHAKGTTACGRGAVNREGRDGRDAAERQGEPARARVDHLSLVERPAQHPQRRHDAGDVSRNSMESGERGEVIEVYSPSHVHAIRSTRCAEHGNYCCRRGGGITHVDERRHQGSARVHDPANGHRRDYPACAPVALFLLSLHCRGGGRRESNDAAPRGFRSNRRRRSGGDPATRVRNRLCLHSAREVLPVGHVHRDL